MIDAAHGSGIAHVSYENVYKTKHRSPGARRRRDCDRVRSVEFVTRAIVEHPKL